MVHPALLFMTAPHDTSAPVLPFSPEFPLQSVCILLSAFQPLVLLLIRPSCRGHAHCHSPWSCVHHNTLYSNADVYGHSRIINSWKCSPDMRHSLLSQSNTGISRANALKLAFAGIIKLLLYFPCCIAMDLTFLYEKRWNYWKIFFNFGKQQVNLTE